MGDWLYLFFGLGGSGRWFNFMTGFGQFLPTLGVFGMLGAYLRKHNCHTHGCWRLARHPTRNGVVLCRYHHPSGGYQAR